MGTRRLDLAMSTVIHEVARQDHKWGEQNHPDGTGPNRLWTFRIDGDETYAELRDFVRREVDDAADRGDSNWLGILLEEVLEAFAEDDPARLVDELVQVAAVAVQWILAIERRTHAEDRGRTS